MRFAQDKIIVDGDMSADVVSEPILLDQIIGYALQCVYTGSPDGSLRIEVSCDTTDFPSRIVNWDTLGSSTVLITTAGITTYNVDMQYYKWMRVYYDFSAGSGVLNVVYNAKG
jgi:hypothetical protein